MDKKTALLMMKADFARFQKESIDFSKSVKDLEQEARNYIHALLTQVTKTGSGPLLAKTPKRIKKRNAKIKAIPENDEMESDCLSITSNSNSSQILEMSDIRPGRAKRGASIKAADSIKKQQSATLISKLRRPSENNDESLINKIKKESGIKRPKESLVSSEDEDIRPSKQSKTEKKKTSKNENEDPENTHNSTYVTTKNQTFTSKSGKQSFKRKLEDEDEDVNATLTSENSTRQNSFSENEPVAKKAHYAKSSTQKKEVLNYHSTLEKISEKSDSSKQSRQSGDRITRASSMIKAQSSQQHKNNNIVNETADMSNADETLASMYEDAIGKPLPIMNSTMNPNTTVTLEKMMNVTVVLETLPKKVMNETVTIQKNIFKEPISQKNNVLKELPEQKYIDDKLPSTKNEKKMTRSQRSSSLKSQKDIKVDKFDELITDDESSPERKISKTKKEKLSNQHKRMTRSTSLLISDDDEVHNTPNVVAKQNKDFKLTSTVKSAYKQPLFSPYAKDSVKKRVEAFEQVAVSPKNVETDLPGRVTRTKTRALAAANSEIPAPTIGQKLARKSLAKAKKISLAKQAKEFDDTKENENVNIMKATKTSSFEKSIQKPQPKTTPLGKSRMLQIPSSAHKTQFATPSNTHSLNAYSKSMTAPRGNIVTHVDSFIQPLKSASKPHDRAAEERRRREHEEDARRKREELLKAQAEEKRRKREEKELKNRLAREAKEKLELEKRLKAEKEKKEKAKLAQQLQDKQKEEMEKKRVAQLQRALEKEERRKQEELLRMQRLQEQEEQERLLAEQKRREQEMEKRKQAELRHQLSKNQLDKVALQNKQAKVLLQKQATYNYKIDSDPDEEDTDDESKPKHQIPSWAMKHVRQAQLAMQQYIPIKSVLRYFDAKKCTPDLRDLFKGIDPKKLKRSSSAIWKTPPRFSMMDRSVIRD